MLVFKKTSRIAMTVIEIRRHAWGWKVFEAPGVEPVFPEKPQAINYAQNRASFRCGEIRILDSAGKLERTIAFRNGWQVYEGPGVQPVYERSNLLFQMCKFVLA